LQYGEWLFVALREDGRMKAQGIKFWNVLAALVLSATFAVGSATANAVVLNFELTITDGTAKIGSQPIVDIAGYGGQGTFTDGTSVFETTNFGTFGPPGSIVNKITGGVLEGFRLTWGNTNVDFTVADGSTEKGWYAGSLLDANGTNITILGNWKLTLTRPVPEPGSLALLGVAVLGFGIATYLRKRT
jgi:PEP-CTERM motif-containing protein